MEREREDAAASRDADARADTLGPKLLEALNRHGYAFQHTVARLLRERAHKDPTWLVEDVDVPVATLRKDTSIDIVLSADRGGALMTIECKRVNPAFGHWCFARARHPDSSVASTEAIVERYRTSPARHSAPVTWGRPAHVADVALELKTSARGDPCPRGKDLDDATAQAFTGLAGMLHSLHKFQGLLRGRPSCVFVPVVVTTAELWWTGGDLSRAKLTTGLLDELDAPVRVPWLGFQYPVGDWLRHQVSDSGQVRNVRELVLRQYLRTLFIVSIGGLDAFMDWASFEGRHVRDIPEML